MEQLKKEQAIVIDGSALVHRAFHALPPFTAPDGTPTNAVYGFIMMLLHLLERPHSHLCVCFDTPVPTFRKELLPTYQATRPKAPDELRTQFPIVMEFLEEAGIPLFRKEGYEADDVIGTIVALFAKEMPDQPVEVVTGDKDLMQLVTDSVHIVMPQVGVSQLREVNAEEVHRILGVQPQHVIDYKGLVGDPSDNYKGIPGVGPKTAQGLIDSYGTIENIYMHADEIPEKLRMHLLSHKDEAFLSKKVATIVRDVPLPISLEALRFTSINEIDVMPFLEKYALYTVMKALRPVQKATPSKPENNQLSFFSWDKKSQ